MGDGHFGFWFWVRYIIALPILLLLSIPFFVIKTFSEKKAFKYYENSKVTERIHSWVWEGR